jgi:hypothetical protein
VVDVIGIDPPLALFSASPESSLKPAPSIQGIDKGVNQLVDMFSPPRLDFS